MSDDTDRLVEGASRGDGAAIESLLARYLPDLERYVRRNAGAVVRSRESGSDLVQSVCREVLERLGSERFEYQGEAEFKQWLYRAALLKIMNRHRFYTADKRDAGREQPLESGMHGRAAEALHRSFATPSGDAMLREDLARIEGAFAQLKPAYREIITLAYVDGLPHKDIAARLAISEANSRVLLSRALARLAKLGITPQARSGEHDPTPRDTPVDD